MYVILEITWDDYDYVLYYILKYMPIYVRIADPA